MRLLQEADRLFPDDPPGRCEYRIVGAHVDIGCPGCGGVTSFYYRTFTGIFICRFKGCGHEERVNLTGERPR